MFVNAVYGHAWTVEFIFPRARERFAQDMLMRMS